ncbi:hypothetical protein [Streptomyces pinistramenti]|uniref:hypothetical protein n=1 Tax=Streptomyces pinistramenti TaxID=2884812 RepID=UPI001D0873D5|nr:hypothetical protein [Streptomyces pinistramenti]MCB5909858.1 hypothetical protein [Streptomyces pinistramenti]
MAFTPGDLTHEVLARSHHYSHYHSSHGSYGGSGGSFHWWEWLIVLVGGGVVIWSMIKKFSSR